MSEYDFHFKQATASDRSFCLFMGTLLLILSTAVYYFTESLIGLTIGSVVGLLLIILALTKPALVAPLNKAWLAFAKLLQIVLSEVILVLIYTVVVVPTGLIVRILGSSDINGSGNSSLKSYWIERSDTAGSMKNQF